MIMQFETIDIKDIKKIAIEAGSKILEVYARDFSVEYKEDESPLTEADTLSNEVICNALKHLYPDTPIMSEENKQTDFEIRKNWDYYWCIDPIDGTKEFIKKNGEFTVNIALIHKNTPVLGVVYAPVLNDIYYAKKGEGAFKESASNQSSEFKTQRLPLKRNKNQEKEIFVVASKSHLSEETQSFIDDLALSTEHLRLVSKGSSLKLCMVAEGEADIYPRLAPTMEWDTAAADAVVREAGKKTVQFESGGPVVYNKENLLNPWFVVR